MLAASVALFTGCQRDKEGAKHVDVFMELAEDESSILSTSNDIVRNENGPHWV